MPWDARKYKEYIDMMRFLETTERIMDVMYYFMVKPCLNIAVQASCGGIGSETSFHGVTFTMPDGTGAEVACHFLNRKVQRRSVIEHVTELKWPAQGCQRNIICTRNNWKKNIGASLPEI